MPYPILLMTLIHARHFFSVKNPILNSFRYFNKEKSMMIWLSYTYGF